MAVAPSRKRILAFVTFKVLTVVSVRVPVTLLMPQNALTRTPTWVAVAAQGNILGATALSVGSLLTAWVLLFSFTFFDRKKTNYQEEA